MNKHISIIALFLTVLSCDVDKCMHGAGNTTSVVYDFDNFDYIEILGMFDIELVQDTNYFVEAINGENILEYVEIKKDSATLKLFDYNACFWLRDYKKTLIKIHFVDIETLMVKESSYIFSTDSIRDSFMFAAESRLVESNLTFSNNNVAIYSNHNTAGKHVFHGKTNQLWTLGFYCVVYDASDLEAKTATIRNYSIADHKVWVRDELKLEIHHTGNILYKGDPEIIVDSISSSGFYYPIK